MPSDKIYGIFSVDPGVTTGCAIAVVDLRQGMVSKCVRRAQRKGVLKTWEVTGCFIEQVWELSRLIDEFFFNIHIERQWVRSMNMTIAAESFSMRQLNANITPVRILAGLEVLLTGKYGDDFDAEGFYKLQSASEAKGFCSDQMLQSWDLWKKRSPHERDALRHLAYRVDKLLLEV